MTSLISTQAVHIADSRGPSPFGERKQLTSVGVDILSFSFKCSKFLISAFHFKKSQIIIFKFTKKELKIYIISKCSEFFSYFLLISQNADPWTCVSTSPETSSLMASPTPTTKLLRNSKSYQDMHPWTILSYRNFVSCVNLTVWFIDFTFLLEHDQQKLDFRIINVQKLVYLTVAGLRFPIGKKSHYFSIFSKTVHRI